MRANIETRQTKGSFYISVLHRNREDRRGGSAPFERNKEV